MNIALASVDVFPYLATRKDLRHQKYIPEMHSGLGKGEVWNSSFGPLKWDSPTHHCVKAHRYLCTMVFYVTKFEDLQHGTQYHRSDSLAAARQYAFELADRNFHEVRVFVICMPTFVGVRREITDARRRVIVIDDSD